jgi:hypothetical protein
MFNTGYILSRRSDFIWFVALPFVAIAVALAGQEWFPATAVVSIGLWVTYPHHFATFLRAYGFADERQRWKWQLFLGPVVILLFTMAGLKWAPLTVVLLGTLWDQQHSLMQQYGFTRIYDFKAQTGGPSTGKFDLALNWIIYGNLLLVSPYWTRIWVVELYQWKFFVSAEAIRTVHTISWFVTASFLLIYAGHLIWTVSRGHQINPMKYVFLSASYFLWYFLAWHANSLLLYTVGHRLMHGLQYDIIAYSYIHRKIQHSEHKPALLAIISKPGNLVVFFALGIFYALVFAFIVGIDFEQFGFGLLRFDSPVSTLPELLEGIGMLSGFQLVALGMSDSVGLVHYYFDSFIWKVRDKKIQAGLT